MTAISRAVATISCADCYTRRPRSSLTSTDTSTLRTWALELKERLGFKRAAVALARKLAVIMHAMLRTGELFDPHEGTPAAA